MNDTRRKADPRRDLGEASLRLLADAVDSATMADLREQILAQPDSYPWREITEEILAVPVDDGRLVQQGLAGQRDWILRGGRELRKSSKQRSKSAAAYFLSRALFFAIYTLAAVVLLILIKHQWPAIDIYRVLDGLAALLPGVFGTG